MALQGKPGIMIMEIKDSDIRVEFYRGSGPGGQHRNVTDSAVRIRHIPTGIVAQASENRSQLRNREVAMERLTAALEKRERKAKKRIATKVPHRTKEKRLTEKKMTSQKKRLRTSFED
jgi:protein subunit release factor B